MWAVLGPTILALHAVNIEILASEAAGGPRMTGKATPFNWPAEKGSSR
ncbi:hypothetical protein [Streptomyces sp. NPDC087300]